MRALESFAKAAVGISGALAYNDAIKDRRLLAGNVSDDQATRLADRITAEPLTALFTLVFAMMPLAWEPSWFGWNPKCTLWRQPVCARSASADSRARST